MRDVRITVLLFLSLCTVSACRLPLAHQPTQATYAPESMQSPFDSSSPGQTDVPVAPIDLISPSDLAYLGAFRLPQGSGRPLTFEYGGAAMTFSPQGDPSGSADGFPGSLFIMGHDRLPYGELPDGNQIAEVSIPAPLDGSLASLNTAVWIQQFSDVLKGHFTTLEEIPRAGLLYLQHPLTGPLLHVAFGAHFQEDTLQLVASHGWIDPNLSERDYQGSWFIGNQSFYSVNGYLFEIPVDFADAYLGGKVIATGRYRDGGWSGMGPELFAYLPWDDHGSPLADQLHLEEAVLLQYADSMSSEDFSRALNGYSHADEWEGGAWLSTKDGRAAVIFAGTKAIGERTWYGWQNPDDPSKPCVETELIGQFILCRTANGEPCPQSDLQGCLSHNDYRGWWSDAFTSQIIFFDPAGLAKVANGQMQPWENQPYAVLDINNRLLHNPDSVEQDMLGSGAQRRNRIGEVAYDRENGLIYILELFADGAQPVVHVWKIH